MRGLIVGKFEKWALKTRYFFAAIVVFGLVGSSAHARELVIASFNLKWYGIGGYKEGKIGKEPRDSDMRQFIKKKLSHSDVLVFQEVVDVERLKNRLIGASHKCRSYSHENKKHQHVVVCYRRDWSFSREQNDDDYVMEEVAMGFLRPAVWGVLRDEEQRPIAHLVAVHLKASPERFETRLKQVEIIASHLKRISDGLPQIIVGDFNTFTNAGRDEEEIFSSIFDELGLERVQHAYRYTFNNQRFYNRFDQMWVSKGYRWKGGASVLGPCNRAKDREEDALRLAQYNKRISDHCPLLVRLTE
ncbi:MAG: endonuclease/exonuclease/phosphatase family protein [Bdellovibrionota bacterium]